LRDLLNDREEIEAVLARGASKARESAAPTLAAAYDALGLLHRQP
jgi:tryptophanyl-tRNA synthetase